MGRGDVEFVCDCNDPFYAFIRRTEPFRVNLCTFYWSAPQNGTDSRAGTILHEVSHFNEIGGTEDHAYGATLVSALARSDPSRAVNNADSIEYFAENTPFREISAGPVVVIQEPVPEPPAPVVFSSLELDAAVDGSVATNDSDYYRVSGADNIVLTANSGDPDLYVYADEDLSRLLCSSDSAGRVDSCAPNTFGTAYIQIYGYSASSYSLVADSGSVPLQLGQTQTGALLADSQQYFTVFDANFVQIDSLSGDADLYVYSSSARTEDSLVCDSRNRSDSTTLDTCELNGAGFITVRGVRDGQFTITSSMEDPALVIVDPPLPVTEPTEPPVAEPVDIPAEEPTVTPVAEPTDPPADIAAGPTNGVGVISSPDGSGGGSAGGGGTFGPLVTVLLLVTAFLRRRLALAMRRYQVSK